MIQDTGKKPISARDFLAKYPSSHKSTVEYSKDGTDNIREQS